MGTTRNLRPVGGGGHQRTALLYCGLQQHSTSKLVYDYIAGFPPRQRGWVNHPGEWPPGTVPQLRRARQPVRRPRTLLIDSEQLESGEKLDDNFRAMAADEIERFRRDIIERTW